MRARAREWRWPQRMLLEHASPCSSTQHQPRSPARSNGPASHWFQQNLPTRTCTASPRSVRGTRIEGGEGR
eukprot:997136-Rhodomonas_salina.6